MAKKQNAACCDGCTCPCCAASCPYCTLTVLIDQLTAKGVPVEVAAKVAAEFVAKQCGC